MKSIRTVARLLVSAALVMGTISCGGDDDDDSAVDGGVSVDARPADSSTTSIDAATAAGNATWTLMPFATCTGIATNCVDPGSGSPYQLVSSGNCPLSSTLQLMLPGGSVPASGTYTVKPSTNIITFASVGAGQIGARIVHHPTASSQDDNWYAQSGTASVVNNGGKLTVTLVNVQGQLNGAGASASMMATVNCP